MNKLECYDNDFFLERFENNFLCFFILQNSDYQSNYLIFESMDVLTLFEDFKDDAQDISPKIIVIKKYDDFIKIFEILKENNKLSFLFSENESDIVLDELKKLLEIKVDQTGKFLFRFYDNYIFDFTMKTIINNRKILNLGRYISEWYWNDLHGDIFYIVQLNLLNSLKSLFLSEDEFKKINDLVYPFHLIPKFKDYAEYAQFETNNKDDFDWYHEVMRRIDLAKKRNLYHKRDVDLYAILSFGLGDDIFNEGPMNEALDKVLVEGVFLEQSLNEINLSKLG
ncbi:hypothetical protein [Acinetobacter sp. YH12097]|uniref:hypothetical protein n=1 Tax=Acinetobacter sp. YH12097 TaxID=2601086 RepID=UPI0015D1C5CA|nr:hypothetical protein [Acinetobacter sp. YH12097]